MLFVTITKFLSFVILARLVSTTEDFLVAVIVVAPTSLQLTIGARRDRIKITEHISQAVHTHPQVRAKRSFSLFLCRSYEPFHEPRGVRRFVSLLHPLFVLASLLAIAPASVASEADSL